MSREYNEFCCWTIEKFSFFHNYFAIIDTADYLADQLFIKHQVRVGFGLSSCARMLPIASSCASAASVMSMLSWQRSVNCPTRCSCAGILTTLHSARILKRKFKPFETMEVFLPMKQMIPLKKQSKKAQKEQHAKQRGSWYGISPVTRTVPNGKAYDRNRVKREDREFTD